jgi:hypothetical protein
VPPVTDKALKSFDVTGVTSVTAENDKGENAPRFAAESERRIQHREMRGPSLQELVERHGTYDKITPEAWAAFDREMTTWNTRLRLGDFHRPPYSDLPPDK